MATSAAGREEFARLTRARLREIGLSVSSFAAQLGMSRAGVYRVLDGDNRPIPDHARRWAEVLRLPRSQQRRLLDLIGYVVEQEDEAAAELSPSDWRDAVPVESLAHAARRVHEDAALSPTPAASAESYHHARRILAWLCGNLQQRDAGHFAALRADCLLRLADVNNVQNRLGQAYVAAEQARRVARAAGNAATEADALRVSGVVLTNQERYQHAVPVLRRAVSLAAGLPPDVWWRFYARRDLLIAQVGRGDVRVDDGVRLLTEAEQIGDPLLVLLARETLARVLLAARQVEQAQRLLDAGRSWLDPSLIGPLHRMVVLGTMSRVFANDRDRWTSLLIDAGQLADQAGLRHQLARLLRFHPRALDQLPR